MFAEDHGIYIPPTPSISVEQNAEECDVERERVALYQHLIDDPVESRRKEVAKMSPAQKQSIILSHSINKALGAAVTGGVVTGIAVMGALQMSPLFRKSTAVSSRLAPVVIATLGSFMLVNELEIAEATKVGSDQFVEGKNC
jgi:hypothetical protein